MTGRCVAGLPPSDSLLSLASAPSLGPSNATAAATAAEGTSRAGSWAEGPLAAAASSPPPTPRHAPSRLRHEGSGSREGSRHSSSRDSSRHSGAAAALVLGVALATPEQQAADEGVQATAGAIAVAGIEVAAEVLDELEEEGASTGPLTPASGAWEAAEVAPTAAGTPPHVPFEGPRWAGPVCLLGMSAGRGWPGVLPAWNQSAACMRAY